jgi:hypothetical protein
MSDTDDPLQADLARLAGQEERLQLPALNTDVARTIGMQPRAMALARMSARFEIPRSTAKGPGRVKTRPLSARSDRVQPFQSYCGS